MKGSNAPDDGSEAKVRVRPGPSFSTFTVPFTSFAGLNTTSVYVITEFVFENNDPQETVDFRNIRLLC